MVAAGVASRIVRMTVGSAQCAYHSWCRAEISEQLASTSPAAAADMAVVVAVVVSASVGGGGEVCAVAVAVVLVVSWGMTGLWRDSGSGQCWQL